MKMVQMFGMQNEDWEIDQRGNKDYLRELYAAGQLYKEGDIVGLWSLAIPLVLGWSHPEKFKKIDSIYCNEALAALMDEKGCQRFYIACDKHSPYYRHMDKFGYHSLNWAPSLFYKNLR